MYRYDEFDERFVRERVAQFTDQVTRRLDGSLTEERVDAAAARVLAAKGVDACAVDSDGAPQVEVSDVPSDEPVVNPTVQ